MHIKQLPPIGFQFGWSIGRFADQVLLLFTSLTTGASALFGSPSRFLVGSERQILESRIAIGETILEGGGKEGLARSCSCVV